MEDRSEKEWEMFVSCFLKYGLWCPTHLEVGVQYLAGEGGPGGWSCLSGVGKSGSWLCRRGGQVMWPWRGGALGSCVCCGGRGGKSDIKVRCHTLSPWGSSRGSGTLSHVAAHLDPLPEAMACLCLAVSKMGPEKWLNRCRINTSTFTRVPLPFPS